VAKKQIDVSGGLRTDAEANEAFLNKELFENNPSNWETKIENFPKYVKRQNLTRFLALYEIFKKIVTVKGSIVECGVNHGYGLMSWTKFSAILEPVNLTRRIYGFDTFEGFPEPSEKDKSNQSSHVKAGDLAADTYKELNALNSIHDTTRFLGHIEKVKLIKGDATETIPQFIKDNPHVLISLLFLDFDLYEPTKVALENFYSRIPKGGIIAFDELDNPLWPGETQAMLEFFENESLEIQRLPFDPYIGFAVK
jgi:hypothetical protein